MKKLFTIISIISCIFFISCAGLLTDPKPVQVYQNKDQNKECEQIKKELNICQRKYLEIHKRRTEKYAANGVVTVLGILIFPPLLFALDVSNTDQIEINAWKSRYENLVELHKNKKCTFIIAPLQEYEDEENTNMVNH